MTGIVEWAVSNTRLILRPDRRCDRGGRDRIHARSRRKPIPTFRSRYLRFTSPILGISPEDSERLLVKPLETNLRSIEGLKTITAPRLSGRRVILLEFDADFNKQKALEDVRAQVDATRAAPAAGCRPARSFRNPTRPLPGYHGRSVRQCAGAHPAPILRATFRDDIKTDPQRAAGRSRRRPRGTCSKSPSTRRSWRATASRKTKFTTRSRNNNRLIAAGSIDTGHGNFDVKVPGVIDNAAGRAQPAHPLDGGFHRHAAGCRRRPADLLRRDQLCPHERPADHRHRCHQAHRHEHHRQTIEKVHALVDARQKTGRRASTSTSCSTSRPSSTTSSARCRIRSCSPSCW